MIPRNALVLTFIVILMAQCAAYKILTVFPFPVRSHSILGEGVVRHLLNAGHEVTYITPFVTNNTNPNLRQIDVTDNYNTHDTSSIDIRVLMTKKKFYGPDALFKIIINITKKTLKNVNVLNLLNDPGERFDVVISQWMYSEVFSGFSTVYNCPHIWFALHEASFAELSVIDEVLNPSYTAGVELNFVPPLSFWQRVKSLHFQVDWMFRYYLMYRSVQKEVFDKTFGPIVKKKNRILPSYEEVRLNASLMLGNNHVSLGQAIRLPQNYIPIGGQHIEEDVKPLPENIKKVMDEAKHGVIYFSMGTNLKSKELPNSIKQGILKLFAELKQTIIWKFEDTLPNLPENVHILPWAPQQSILSHPRCIMFINHGGLLSTMEAIHFGVPFIGIPVFFDQQLNVEKAVLKGIAIKVELTDRVAEHLKNAVHEMLSTSKYRERIKEISFIYHHRPVKPGKELVHWIEHVVKTGGAMHLRSPALLMPWYQKIYLDLVLIVLMLIILMFLGIKLCLSLRLNKRKVKPS